MHSRQSATDADLFSLPRQTGSMSPTPAVCMNSPSSESFQGAPHPPVKARLSDAAPSIPIGHIGSSLLALMSQTSHLLGVPGRMAAIGHGRRWRKSFNGSNPHTVWARFSLQAEGFPLATPATSWGLLFGRCCTATCKDGLQPAASAVECSCRGMSGMAVPRL